MPKIEIILKMEMPKVQAEKANNKLPKKPSVEDQIKECIDCIESGEDSYTEWKVLNKLYKQLRTSKGNRTARVQNLINMIEPVLSKYGLHGVSEEK